MNENKEWLQTIVTFGIVIRCNIDSIKDIKESIGRIQDIEVVYQHTSADPLFITRTNPSQRGIDVKK